MSGQIINHYIPFRNFSLYQALFTPALIIAFNEIRVFLIRIDEYRAMTVSHRNDGSGAYIARLVDSGWSIPGLVIVGFLYIYSTITLKYIHFNLVGFYALLAIVPIMISAILGQTCYVYYILLLRRLCRQENLRYNFYLPARTDWVQLLARIGSRLSNAFFVLGFIYTAVYFLNMPADYVEISLSPLSISFSTPNDLVFIASWITIFIIIILAFPAYAALKSRYLKLIVRNLKDMSIREVDLLVRESGVRKQRDVDAELKYLQLMQRIEESDEAPFRTSNLLPIAATLSSVAVHIIKISESLPR